MASVEEEEEAAPAAGGEEDAAWEEYSRTAERRHVDVLLDISEEDSMREEEEPYEYHCYPGAEEAVRGWARVAPLGCILLSQKKHKKPKQKEADNPILTPVEPAMPTADSVASSESNTGSCENFRKSTSLKEQSNSSVSGWPVLSALHKTTSHLSLEEKTEEHIVRETPVQLYHLPTKQSETKATKAQRDSQRPSNAVVPIKNFTFLPPIKAPHPRMCVQLSSKSSEGRSFEDNCETRGTRADPAGNTQFPTNTSKYRTCRRNPHLFSALSVSISKKYQLPVSSKAGTAQHSRYSMAKAHCLFS